MDLEIPISLGLTCELWTQKPGPVILGPWRLLEARGQPREEEPGPGPRGFRSELRRKTYTDMIPGDIWTFKMRRRWLRSELKMHMHTHHNSHWIFVYPIFNWIQWLQFWRPLALKRMIRKRESRMSLYFTYLTIWLLNPASVDKVKYLKLSKWIILTIMVWITQYS